MAIGTAPNANNLSQSLTDLALSLRETCVRIANFQTYVVSLGQAGLVAAGFSAADAAAVLAQASYLNTIAGCYYGTVQQGGSNGTGAIMFNFHNELSPLWAGQ